jgi:hypothetical protein
MTRPHINRLAKLARGYSIHNELIWTNIVLIDTVVLASALAKYFTLKTVKKPGSRSAFV